MPVFPQIPDANVETEVIKVNPLAPDEAVISRAAELIRGGELVAFPTETVYGLGANALDSAAVQKIFEAKGRPATNPLIVHVSDSESARQIVADWPESAQKLADLFWPGPLTLVLPKTKEIPKNVTAGGSTIAVRVPNHAIAQALLKAAGVPIAAPSANRSTRLSPTRAEHVLKSLAGRIPLILDGGPTKSGVESTVLDLTDKGPRILRPGPITFTDMEPHLDYLEYAPVQIPRGLLPSPGMMRRHYAPNTRLELASSDAASWVKELLDQGNRVGWLAWPEEARLENPDLRVIEMPTVAESYGAQLYDALHRLDEGLDVIIVSLPPEDDAWRAVRNRLTRAAFRGWLDK